MQCHRWEKRWSYEKLEMKTKQIFGKLYWILKNRLGAAVSYSVSFLLTLLGSAVMWSPTSEISPYFAAVMMSRLPAILAAAAA